MSAKFDKRHREQVERDVAELMLHLNRIQNPALRAALIEFIVDTGRTFEAAERGLDGNQDKHRLN